MRILNERAIGELNASVLKLAEGLAQQGWSDVVVLKRLVEGNKLDPTSIIERLQSTQGGTAAV